MLFLCEVLGCVSVSWEGGCWSPLEAVRAFAAEWPWGQGLWLCPALSHKSCRLRKDAAPDYSQLHGRPYLEHWKEWEGSERGHAGQRWREMGFGDAVREDTQDGDGRK